MNTQEAIELLDSVVGRVGNDEEIEAVNADLVTLKEFLLGIDATVEQLNEDVARLNEKNRGLLSSNNNLYRQIGHQQEIVKKANEEVSAVSAINEIFE